MKLSRPVHILLIEDSRHDAALIEDTLLESYPGFILHVVEAETELLRCLRDNDFGLVLSDHNLPGLDSHRALELIRQNGPSGLPFIIVSGSIGEETAVALMRAGASDFVSKQCLSRLIPVIERELAEYQVRREKVASELRLEAVCEELKQANHRLKNALHTVTQTQESLVRVERLRSLGEMSSGIAHDFNNILTKMVGAVEELCHRRPEEETLAVTQLKTLTKDGAAIVRRLRDFYADHPPAVGSVPIDLNELVKETLELTRPKWQSQRQISQTEIHTRGELNEIPHVSADPSHLREVLTNLIFNSCDAMRGGGSLTILTRADGDRVVVEVRDTGGGMTEEVRQRCLEPFYTTKGSHGTGLGLALAVNVIRGLGGELEIESTFGQGTSVLLRLPPYRETQVSSDLPQVAAGVPVETLSVLVVDDDPLIAQLVGRHLQKEGHSVVSVTSGVEALSKLAVAHFDVIISDRAMPDMNGDELAVRARESYPGIPFIMATGYGDLMIVSGVDPSGVDLILAKPFDREDLRRALQAVVLGTTRGKFSAA